MSDDFHYSNYLSVSGRRLLAERKMKKLRQEGYELSPIEPFGGSKIAKSFWGHAWCRHLESYSDFDNRLPRGRSYVRNGSVCHLAISSGKVEALVQGSELYEATIRIEPLPAEKWDALKARCSGKIGSLLELLQGRLSDEIMGLVAHRENGLFPSPKEIRLDCNCPDYADLCKHLAAVLYGVGVRLDSQPELLFRLRGVDHSELIDAGFDKNLEAKPSSGRRRLAADALSDVFGIEFASEAPGPADPLIPPAPPAPPSNRLTADSERPVTKRVAKSRKAKSISSPKTGDAVAKLRRKFGMTEWEFGLIAEVTSVTVRNWEEAGKADHNARPKNQQTLDLLAQLSKPAAWERLEEYL